MFLAQMTLEVATSEVEARAGYCAKRNQLVRVLAPPRWFRGVCSLRFREPLKLPDCSALL